MNATLPRLAATALAVLACAAGAGPPETDDEAVVLEPLVVREPVAPLDRSMHLLRLLVQRSAPCLGCDAVLVERRRPAAVSMLEYLLLPAPPPEVDEATRQARDIKLQDSPDLDYLRKP